MALARHSFSLALVGLCVALITTGCSDDAPADDGSGGAGATGGEGGNGGAGGGGGAPCTPTTFEANAFQASGSFPDHFEYIGQNGNMPPDLIGIWLRPGTYPEVGLLPINASDFATCNNCVLLGFSCEMNLFACEQTFIATSGIVEFTASGMAFDPLEGELRNLELVEATVTREPDTSTVVDGGETLCIDSFSFDTVIAQ